MPGARLPLWDPILSFTHTFSPKSASIGGPRPPNGCTPPTGNPGSATANNGPRCIKSRSRNTMQINKPQYSKFQPHTPIPVEGCCSAYHKNSGSRLEPGVFHLLPFENLFKRVSAHYSLNNDLDHYRSKTFIGLHSKRE